MSPGVRALVSLAVIVVSAGLLRLAWTLQPPPPPPPSDVASMFSFPPEDVRAVDVRTGEGAIRAVREDGVWRVESFELADSPPPGAPVVPPGPERVAREVAFLVERLASLPDVARFPLDGRAGVFGLDDPRVTVELVLASGERVVLRIGDRTTTGAGLYARVGDSDDVVQIGGLILNEIAGALYQLRGLAGGPP